VGHRASLAPEAGDQPGSCFHELALPGRSLSFGQASAGIAETAPLLHAIALVAQQTNSLRHQGPCTQAPHKTIADQCLQQGVGLRHGVRFTGLTSTSRAWPLHAWARMAMRLPSRKGRRPPKSLKEAREHFPLRSSRLPTSVHCGKAAALPNQRNNCMSELA